MNFMQSKPLWTNSNMHAASNIALVVFAFSFVLGNSSASGAQQYQTSKKSSKPANATDAAWSCATSDQAVRTIRLCTPIINDPKTSEKRRIRYLLKRAKAWVVEEELWAAVTDYGRVNELNPKNTKALIEQGRLYVLLKEHASAIESYSKLIDEMPENLPAICLRAASKLKLGQQQAAFEDYALAEKIGPLTAECVVGRGDVYAARGENEIAFREYTKAIGLNDRFWIAYYRRAELFKKLGKEDLAIEEYSRILQLNSVNIYARHQLRDLGIREPYP